MSSPPSLYPSIVQSEKEMISAAMDTDVITPALAVAIKTLWSDEGIQATYAERSKFQLNDSCA